jgi:hypothetical protein
MEFLNSVQVFVSQHLKRLTADTLLWIAAIVLHCSTVPSVLALMAGITDRPPNIDVVMFIWVALVLLFARAIVLKDQLNVVTIGCGFIAQAVLLAFIVFR